MFYFKIHMFLIPSYNLCFVSNKFFSMKTVNGYVVYEYVWYVFRKLTEKSPYMSTIRVSFKSVSWTRADQRYNSINECGFNKLRVLQSSVVITLNRFYCENKCLFDYNRHLVCRHFFQIYFLIISNNYELCIFKSFI